MKKIYIFLLVFVFIFGGINLVKADNEALDFGSESYNYSESSSKLSPQTNTSDDGSELVLPNPIQDETIIEVVNRLLGWLLILSLPIAIALIMFAGYGLIMSQGDKGKVQKAWDTVKNVLIGLSVIFLSKTIVWLIIYILGGKSN